MGLCADSLLTPQQTGQPRGAEAGRTALNLITRHEVLRYNAGLTPVEFVPNRH